MPQVTKKPTKVAILGATTPLYEQFCPNWRGMKDGLSKLKVEHKLFNIRPSVDTLELESIRQFDPDMVIYGLIDMVKTHPWRMKIRRAFPNAKIVMWYGDLRNEETGQIRADMSEIDAMFVSNNDQSEYYKRIWRVPECHFLPLGSTLHKPAYNDRFDFNTVFIGSIIDGKGFSTRANIMRNLKGSEVIKHIDGPVGHPNLRAKIMKAMPIIYRSSKLSLDWSHFTCIPGYTSNRFWIIPASAGVAMTKRWPGCEEFYPEGTRIYFDSLEEFYEKREYYLQHQNEREKIRRAGYKQARHHTYEMRFAKMFKVLYG